MTTRETAIVLLKVAGYHYDSQAFIRLVAEHKIPMSDAGLAFDQGGKMREMGVPCHCHDCTTLKREP